MAERSDARRDEATAWVESVLVAAPFGIVLVDPDLRCLRVNDAAAALSGSRPATSHRGRRLHEVLPGIGEQLAAAVRIVFETGEAGTDVEVEATTPGPPAETRWWLARCFPVLDLANRVRSVGVVLVDVTERKTSERERLRLLAEARAAQASAESAARRTRILQGITAAFAAAVTPEVVADVVVRAGVEAVDAAGGAVYLLDAEGARLRAADAVYPTPSGEPLPEVSLESGTPIAETVRTGRPVWISDTDELHRRYPGLGSSARSGATWGAHAALPLSVQGDTLGGLVFSWSTPRRFDHADREFLGAIASHCSQALQRAELFRIEREARSHTERSAEHALRLERITGSLAGANEPEEVIDRFLDRGLAELGASHGAVFEIDEANRVLRPPGHRSPPRHGDVPLDGPSALAEAARTAEPVLLERTEEIRQWFGDDVPCDGPEQTWAAAPLSAYGNVLGVMGLRFEDRLSFDADDRAFLARVGQRLGEALERSRLYEHQRHSRELAEAAARWLQSVQSLAAALARGATRLDVANALREHVQSATHADFALVAALSSDRSTVDVLTRTGSFELPTSRLDESVERAIRDALARGRTVELPSLRELRATFPGLADDGLQSLVLLPIGAGRRVVAAIGLGWTRPGAIDREGRRLLTIAADLGGTAFERAVAYDLDHQIADTLQRHLLTEPVASAPGVRWAARYAPGSERLTAGGDWYDVIPLSASRLALVVGDIVGHGIVAAAAMGQLRSATRALAPREHPAGLLEALDRYVTSTEQGNLSSLAYCSIDLARGFVECAIAGHPPPLMRHPDGRVELVEGARGPLLGIARPGGRRSFRRRLEAGTSFVLYTDGLVERRGEPIDKGMTRLQELVSRTPANLHPEGLCDRLLAQLRPTGTMVDDITLLVVDIEPSGPTLERAYPARLDMLRTIRAEAMEWLIANDIARADADDIVLALADACADAIEHGSGNDPTRTVGVQLRAEPDAVDVEVTDSGTWSSGDRPSLPGRRLHISRSLADDTVRSVGVASRSARRERA